MYRILALAALMVATPASAQMRVLVDGKAMDIPAGVMRTIISDAKGKRIVDKPWTQPATPGVARIVTVEKVEEDDTGKVLSRSFETRIEPQYVAYAQQIVPLPPQPNFSYAPQPRIEMDMGALDGEDTPSTVPQIIRIKRDGWGGHFVAPIRINGVKVRAIIDTGAAYTILTPEAALAAGIQQADSTEPAYGIGGLTSVGVVRLKTLEIGGQQLGGTTVRIGQSGIPYTLLGQTEIARIGRVVIEDGVLTIIPRGAQMASR